MPTYQENQKRYYTTRHDVLKIFRDEQKKNASAKKRSGVGRKTS